MIKDPAGKIERRIPMKVGRTPVLRWLMVLLLLLVTACGHHPPAFTVERLPGYEALFEPSQGWAGGDGVFSVGLDHDRILWLFGDTFIGEVADGRRIQSVLVNNTMAVQTGKEPPEAAVQFFHGQTNRGEPAAFLRPSDGLGWFWPYHGVRTKDGLFLFLIQVDRTEGPPAFDFRPLATWLVSINNPDDPPNRWKFRQQKIPWGHEHRLFGSAVLLKEEHCFIFGTVDETSTGFLRKQLIVARVPVARMLDFSQWRFYSQGEWVAEADQADRLCDNVANEFSVSFQPAINRYVLLYTQDSLSEYIVFRLAPEPYGPWGKPVRVYRCPEAQRDPRLFCYAAKGHPELSLAPADLIFTYTTNATDFALIESDTRLYRPRFLRLRFQGP